METKTTNTTATLKNTITRGLTMLLFGGAAVAMVACGGQQADDPLPIVEATLGLAEGTVTFDGKKWDREDVLAPKKKAKRPVQPKRQTDPELGPKVDRHDPSRFTRKGMTVGVAVDPTALLRNKKATTATVAGQPKHRVGAAQKLTDIDQKAREKAEAQYTIAPDSECPSWAPCRICATSTGRCACIICDPEDNPLAPKRPQQGPVSAKGPTTPADTAGDQTPGGDLVDPPR
jgi:hypothetical protein